MSLQRERTFILALLLILAAASWAILIWQSSVMNSMDMGLTMGMGATLFLAIWVVMMIAMMFPATAPMNLVFARVQRGLGPIRWRERTERLTHPGEAANSIKSTTRKGASDIHLPLLRSNGSRPAFSKPFRSVVAPPAVSVKILVQPIFSSASCCRSSIHWH